MNILFTRFPLESAYGGAEVQTLSLMNGLKERGHNISFLGSCSVLLDQTAKLKMKNVQLNIGSPPVTKWTALSFIWRKKKMKEKLIGRLRSSDSKIAAVIMLSLSEKLLLTPWALQQGIKVFWIEHDRIGHSLTWNPWLPPLRRLSKHVTTIVVSELSRKMYLDLGWPTEKTIAIPNGVYFPSPPRGEEGHPPERTRSVRAGGEGMNSKGGGGSLHIGCVARLTPDKGVDVLIDAVADMPEVELTILGRGPEEGYLRKLIDERNLTNRVHMQSWLNNIGDFYSTIDTLVLPSRDHDPFGLVAAEAMLYGVAVVVTEACGIAGYLESGIDAIVVPENSALALKEGIKRMSNRECRMKIATEGQKTAQEKFSLEKMIDAYERVLHSPSP